MNKYFSLIILVMCLIAGQSIMAQTSNHGAVIGTVKDESGGVVPATTIRVINTQTGVARTVQTDQNGNYRVDFLNPGEYKVEAEATGFRKAEINRVTVHVSESFRADINLQVGGIDAEVVVTDASTAINTENSTLGEVITEQMMDDMPLTGPSGREFINLVGLLPGVETGSGKTGAVASKGVAAGIGGARSSYNSYYVDGADSTDSYFGQLVSSPAADAIKEFRVETSLYSARYGRAGGGVISVVTKSGTNKFNGTVSNYYRNNSIDALPFLYTGSRENAPEMKYNQFGATFGGPIIKNRTFFFASTEFFRSDRSSMVEGFAPTDLERQGNFTLTNNPYASVPTPVVIVNPYVSANPTCNVNNPGPPYCAQVAIPSKILPGNLINPLGQRLMDLIPEANYDDPVFNLRVYRPLKRTTDKYLLKIDHNFRDGSTLNGSYNYGVYDVISPGLTEFADTNVYDYGKTLALGYTRVLGANLASDTKFNYTWSDNGSNHAKSDKNYAAEYDFWVGREKPDVMGFPRVQLYTVGNRFMTLGAAGPNMRNNRQLYIREDLVYVKGKHTLSFGGDYKYQNYGWLYDIAMFGAYYIGFSETGSAANNQNYRVAGHVFASLLTGISSYTNYSYGDSQLARSKRNSFGFYFQDDWKIHDRLTLNLGVRYDFEQAFKSADGKFMTLNWETGMPLFSKDTPQSLLDNVAFNYETGGPVSPYDANKDNIAPRVGFAWRVFNDNSTVVRGGYGMVYTSENLYTTGYGSFVPPFSGQFLWRTRAALQPDRIDHLRPMTDEPYNLPLDAPTSPGSVFANPRYYPTGNVQHWNLGISRTLRWGLLAETSYVASKGTNLNGLGSLRSYDPTLYDKIRTNNPGWTTVSLRLKGFNSSYHSFQAKLGKRAFQNRVSFLAAYTWAHAIADASNDFVDEELETLEEGVYFYERVRKNADFDIRHRFSLAGTYALPFGKLQPYGRNANALVDTLIGGWHLVTVATMQTGQPFSVRGVNGRSPNRICDGNLPSSRRTNDRWFDITCFTDTLTTTVNGSAAQNIIRGPNMLNVDLSLYKNISLTERYKLMLRLDAFNAFNRVNLIGPSLNYFVTTDNISSGLTRARDARSIQFGARFTF